MLGASLYLTTCNIFLATYAPGSIHGLDVPIGVTITAGMESSASPADTPLGQVRILLQTRTHLPVGQDRGEKLEFMKDIVCQHLWKRDFDKGQERWYPYNDLFGLEDRLCFFLIDHFGHNHAQEREGPVPVLRFEWDGEALYVSPEASL